MTAAAEISASRKEAKSVALLTACTFQPITFETLGPMNASAVEFLTNPRQRTHVRRQSRFFSTTFDRFAAL